MTEREVRIWEDTAIRIMAELTSDDVMTWELCAVTACNGADALVREMRARRAEASDGE